MASAEGNQLALVLHGVDDLRLDSVPVRAPSKGEVQIRMQAVGICGTDIHCLKSFKFGPVVLKNPVGMGHEASGIVAALGEGVTNLKVGDHVAIEHPVPCKNCSVCKAGRYNICQSIRNFVAPPYQGCMRRLYNHPAEWCYKLPDHVTFEEGALLEPLSVAVHACQRASVTMGDKILVLGAGPIGLLCLLVAKAAGASEVMITDINEGRLATAKELGADHILKVDSSEDDQDVANKVIEVMGHADRTLECTGVESCICTGVYATKTGGVLALVGIGKDKATIPITDALMREVDIIGVMIYPNCYPAALALVASGQVNVKPLVTHHYKLEESLQAFETSRTGAGGAIKVMIHCDPQNYGKLQGSK